MRLFSGGAAEGMATLLTPKSSLWILVLAGLSWLMQIPAYTLLFMTELARGYYPHWSDAIVIPITQFQSIPARVVLALHGDMAVPYHRRSAACSGLLGPLRVGRLSMPLDRRHGLAACAGRLGFDRAVVGGDLP